MSDPSPFTDPEAVLSMETEHLPLWKAFIRTFAHLLRPDLRILDFGCNQGGLLLLLCRGTSDGLAPIRPSLGVGIDVDTPAMRRILAESAAAVRGRYPLIFSTSRPATFPGQFDLALSHEVVYLLSDLKGTFSEVCSALADGGHFCLTTGCHIENGLFPLWKTSLAAMGVTAFEYSVDDYEEALLASGFGQVTRGRLLLSPAEYKAWTRARPSTAPNPAWFPTASAEESYYTQFGKMVLTARKG